MNVIKQIYTFVLVFFLITPLCFATPPHAEEVFQLTTKQVDPNTFTVDWQIKKGFFLYKKSIQLKAATDSNFHLGMLSFPPPLHKTTAQGEPIEIYRNQLILAVPVLGEQAGEALLDIHYQGCADDGFCYPPQTTQIKLTIDTQGGLANAVVEQDTQPSPATPPPNDALKLSQLFSNHNWPFILLSFFGFGLLLSFTPCILPMVPVLSGIIVGHGNNLSTRKAFFLSLSYVLSMSITYAIVGAIVALMGKNLQVAMQSPWIVSLFSLTFVLLALSMFGFYELRLPLSWQAKLANVTRGRNNGHYLGSAIMGSLSTLILSPCVTAPLIGALGYIAESGDVIFGSLALFFLSLGMGTPLLLVGSSSAKLLPKAGHWMNRVKAFFGIMLLAVALQLMSRVLPALLIMGLWSSLLIFSGLFMGAFTKSQTTPEKFFQGVGLIFIVYGFLILIGASQGNTDPFQPLNTMNVANSKASMSVVKTIAEAQQTIAQAQGKPVMLDFYADWCASCKTMEKTVLHAPRIRQILENFMVVKVDLSANNADTKALLSHFQVIAPPTFLFFDTEGNEMKQFRLVGEISATTFYNHLKGIVD